MPPPPPKKADLKAGACLTPPATPSPKKMDRRKFSKLPTRIKIVGRYAHKQAEFDRKMRMRTKKPMSLEDTKRMLRRKWETRDCRMYLPCLDAPFERHFARCYWDHLNNLEILHWLRDEGELPLHCPNSPTTNINWQSSRMRGSTTTLSSTITRVC